jgi:hypothetical protein
MVIDFTMANQSIEIHWVFLWGQVSLTEKPHFLKADRYLFGLYKSLEHLAFCLKPQRYFT